MEEHQQAAPTAPVEMLVRPDSRYSHEWHVQINRFMDNAGDRRDYGEHRFMYDAKTAADELPRLAVMFGKERRGELTQVHQQCSHSSPESVADNHLTCCLGVKCAECPMLAAIEKMDRRDDDKDFAKAWTCVSHILSNGGDPAGEGFVMTVDDRMFWNNVYESMTSYEA